MRRFPRKRGNAFIAKIREGLFAIGVLHNGGCTTFFNRFLNDPDEPILDTYFSSPLFTADVQMSFFAKNDIYKISLPDDFSLDAIDVPDKVIRIRSRPYDPENPFGWDGTFPDKGGDLYELPDRYNPATSSNGTLLISDLQCSEHRDIIERYELSCLYINEDLRERLAACYLSGRNVDPYKSKVFDECDYLKNEHVLNTSWYIKHRMPLLNLKLESGRWVTER